MHTAICELHFPQCTHFCNSWHNHYSHWLHISSCTTLWSEDCEEIVFWCLWLACHARCFCSVGVCASRFPWNECIFAQIWPSTKHLKNKNSGTEMRQTAKGRVEKQVFGVSSDALRWVVKCCAWLSSKLQTLTPMSSCPWRCYWDRQKKRCSWDRTKSVGVAYTSVIERGSQKERYNLCQWSTSDSNWIRQWENLGFTRNAISSGVLILAAQVNSKDGFSRVLADFSVSVVGVEDVLGMWVEVWSGCWSCKSEISFFFFFYRTHAWSLFSYQLAKQWFNPRLNGSCSCLAKHMYIIMVPEPGHLVPNHPPTWDLLITVILLEFPQYKELTQDKVNLFSYTD